MSYNLVIQSEAIVDIQNAFEWYEEQKPGLGYELIEEIEICYQKLCKHPENYTFINERYRRIQTKRFPYLIIYKIERDNVIINSVFHARRKPR